MNLLKIEFSQNRVYGLDVLRALGILFVVYGHGIDFFSNPMIKHIMALTVLDGVSIFFVLSGFLIGGILIKTVETEAVTGPVLMEFWKRRWFRTLPSYFLVLVFSFVVFNNDNALDLVRYSLFIQNFSTPHPSFFPEAWSLSVEEWFYFLIPLGIFGAIKTGIKPKNSILLLILSIIIMSALIRQYRFNSIEIETVISWDLNFRKQVITRLDSIMFGVLGAYLKYYYSNMWLSNKKMFLLAGVGLLISNHLAFLFMGQFMSGMDIYYYVYSFPVASLGTLLLLPFLSTYKKRGGSVYKTVTIVSLISYPMYLINLNLVQYYFMPLFMKLIPVQLTGLPLEIYRYLAYWLITIVGSILIYKYYEMPLTKLRDAPLFSRIFASRGVSP